MPLSQSVGSKRRGSKQAKQAAEAETTNTYRRAFAACMTGRGYSVK